jgi:hypothetical protein
MIIVFLTYVNRSGSTYLANLLSASEEICVCPEGDKLVTLFLESPGKAFLFDDQTRRELKELTQVDPKIKYWGIQDDIFSMFEEVSSHIDAFLVFLKYYQMKQKPGASCTLFKAERLAYLYPLIESYRGTVYPFKFLSVIRDPRGIYASQKRTIMPGIDKPMSTHPVYSALYWNQYIRAILKFQDQPSSYHVLYQDLINNMDMTLGRIADFLGLNLIGIKPGMGDLGGRLPDEHKGIHPSISEFPLEEKIHEWKRDLGHEELYMIETLCKMHFGHYGFIPSLPLQPVSAKLFKLYYHVGKYWAGRLMRKAFFHLNRISGRDKSW